MTERRSGKSRETSGPGTAPGQTPHFLRADLVALPHPTPSNALRYQPAKPPFHLVDRSPFPLHCHQGRRRCHPRVRQVRAKLFLSLFRHSLWRQDELSRNWRIYCVFPVALEVPWILAEALETLRRSGQSRIRSSRISPTTCTTTKCVGALPVPWNSSANSCVARRSTLSSPTPPRVSASSVRSFPSLGTPAHS